MELYKYIDERHITNNKPYKVINNRIIMNKDYITGKYNLDSIKKHVGYLKNNVKVPSEVVDDFINYSKSKIHKIKDNDFINFDKENSIIVDVVNSKS